MTILNKYILKKFLRPFFASYALLVTLIMLSQVFEQLDRFMAQGVSTKHIVGYILASTPYQAFQILPVACLLGTLFVVGELARTKEYIAGLAGGIPPENFLGGLLVAGLSISIIGVGLNETLVPRATQYSMIVYRDKIKHLGDWRQSVYSDLFVSGQEGRYWSIRLLNLDTGYMDRVVIDTLENGNPKSQIDALNGNFTSEKKWILYNGIERTFNENLKITSTTPFKEKSFSFKENPHDLVSEEVLPENLNYKKLRREIRKLASLGVEVRKLQVELYMKLAFPFSCLVVMLLGIPLAMKGKGNKAMGIAMGGGLTLLYLGFIQFGKAIAQRVIPPLLGAWLGNIVFLCLGIYLWLKMRRTA